MVKACLPALLSVIFYYIFLHVYKSPNKGTELEDLGHPYAVGVLMTGVSFLIVFRANYGYQRYWEACGAVHQMMSKILDATVHTAAFHMQCSHYDGIKPPSFFDHPEFMYQKRSVDRQRLKLAPTGTEPDYAKSINLVNTNASNNDNEQPSIIANGASNHLRMRSRRSILNEGRLDGGWGLMKTEDVQSADNNSEHPASWAINVTPSLFLQELAHLSSLTIAVAFCTLRNDVDGAVSPLGLYIPGSPFPEADPDKMEPEIRNQFFSSSRVLKHLRYFLGIDRTDSGRTKYNANRPMPVLGGVSDNEIIRLQRAKGALAKTQLVWYWLSEFVTREHLAGSTGKVGPPIISRVHQFLSDGMVFYNHARKIMFIPFPFPHAQISSFCIFVMVVYVPFLMDQYTEEEWVGASLTFFTVLCLAGLHEVARELENPFRNVPNDIPLCTLLAMHNEALVTMCTGYHPDHYWSPDTAIPPKPAQKQQSEPSQPPLSPLLVIPNNKPQSDSNHDTKKQIYENKISELEKSLEMYQKQILDLRSLMSTTQ